MWEALSMHPCLCVTWSHVWEETKIDASYWVQAHTYAWTHSSPVRSWLTNMSKGLTCLGIGLLSCATLCSSMQGGLTWWNVSAWCLLFLDGVHEGAQRPNSSWWCLFCGRAGFSLSSLVSKTGMCYFIGCLIQAALMKGVNVYVEQEHEKAFWRKS